MTQTTTAHLTITRIEDREGEGDCSHCQRTGLRWIVILSDGTAVGVECAKKVLGYKPAPKSYQWVQHFTVEATKVERWPNGEETHWAMWTRKDGRETRETSNGVLVTVGGVRADWTRKGWL